MWCDDEVGGFDRSSWEQIDGDESLLSPDREQLFAKYLLLITRCVAPTSCLVFAPGGCGDGSRPRAKTGLGDRHQLALHPLPLRAEIQVEHGLRLGLLVCWVNEAYLLMAANGLGHGRCPWVGAW